VSGSWVTNCAVRVGGVAVLTAALLTGCLFDSSCSTSRGLPGGLRDLAVGTSLWSGAASASCAAGIEYQGRFYVAWSDRLPAVKGEPLGEAVDPPRCNDGNIGCSDEPDTQGPPIEVWALPGADPNQIIVSQESGRLIVYGSLDADPKDYFRFSHGVWHLRANASAAK
jgi:hypothetical protein